jgi:arylformamidase
MTEGRGIPQWRSLNAQERALAYSPSKALPDGDLTPYIEGYAKDSAAIYAAHPNMQTLHYGDSPTQTIDLFVPDTTAPAPLVIYIHGGYWQALSKLESTFAAQGFLDNGIAFAAVDYTLAPDASLTQIEEECVRAVQHLYEHEEHSKLDKSRITLCGSSAGAHLVAMTCINLPFEPKCAVLLSGIYDLEPLIGTYVNDPLHLNVETARHSSPIHHDLSRFPKALLAYGEIETDEFKRQSHAFAALLPDAECLEIPTRNHFDIVYDISNESALAARVLELVRTS